MPRIEKTNPDKDKKKQKQAVNNENTTSTTAPQNTEHEDNSQEAIQMRAYLKKINNRPEVLEEEERQNKINKVEKAKLSNNLGTVNESKQPSPTLSTQNVHSQNIHSNSQNRGYQYPTMNNQNIYYSNPQNMGYQYPTTNHYQTTYPPTMTSQNMYYSNGYSNPQNMGYQYPMPNYYPTTYPPIMNPQNVYYPNNYSNIQNVGYQYPMRNPYQNSYPPTINNPTVSQSRSNTRNVQNRRDKSKKRPTRGINVKKFKIGKGEDVVVVKMTEDKLKKHLSKLDQDSINELWNDNREHIARELVKQAKKSSSTEEDIEVDLEREVQDATWFISGHYTRGTQQLKITHFGPFGKEKTKSKKKETD